jgi:Ser/Thr protein kinase RdoA (MazF antagonist)
LRVEADVDEKAMKDHETEVGTGSGLFPVTRSILSADALRAEVAEAYAIDTPFTCQLLRPSMNDTYLLTNGDDRYIARVYGAHWRSASEIAYELELLVYLAARGISVSVPIAARDTSLMCPLFAPEGIRHLVLFTYAQGTPLSWRKHCYLMGRLLAAIHMASEHFVCRHTRSHLDLKYLIDAPMAALRPFFAHRSEDWSYLEESAARLRARVEAAACMGLEWGVCHGDFGPKNIHIAEDRTCTVYDFDLCGPSWRAYDLAPVWPAATATMDPRKTAVKRAIWGSFLKGYTETRCLGATDLAVVPLFHSIMRLWGLGARARAVARRGALLLSDSELNRELALFREWEAERLEGK